MLNPPKRAVVSFLYALVLAKAKALIRLKVCLTGAFIYEKNSPYACPL